MQSGSQLHKGSGNTPLQVPRDLAALPLARPVEPHTSQLTEVHKLRECLPLVHGAEARELLFDPLHGCVWAPEQLPLSQALSARLHGGLPQFLSQFNRLYQ